MTRTAFLLVFDTVLNCSLLGIAVTGKNPQDVHLVQFFRTLETTESVPLFGVTS